MSMDARTIEELTRRTEVHLRRVARESPDMHQMLPGLQTALQGCIIEGILTPEEAIDLAIETAREATGFERPPSFEAFAFEREMDRLTYENDYLRLERKP